MKLLTRNELLGWIEAHEIEAQGKRAQKKGMLCPVFSTVCTNNLCRYYPGHKDGAQVRTALEGGYRGHTC
jgi:hypothetical protein